MAAFIPPLIAAAARYVLTRAFASVTANTTAQTLIGSNLANAEAPPEPPKPEISRSVCTFDKPFG